MSNYTRPPRNPEEANKALLWAIQRAGSQGALARAAGVTRQAVTSWMRRGYIPISAALLRAAHELGVSPKKLRPDLFPEEIAVIVERSSRLAQELEELGGKA
jgi:transcriptional regulator with XRE-family HTH domain